MNRIDFEVEFLTDVCLSSTAQTLGTHETLDHVPGRVLWGVAANAAYKSMPSAEADDLFQRGAVRFLAAVPYADQPAPERAAPTPTSWHQEKGAPKEKEGKEFLNFCWEKVRNESETKQFKSIGGTWRFLDGSPVPEPARRMSLRTSVRPDGKARDGLLFGIEALPAGLRLHSAITGENRADLERVFALLSNQEIRIGRSRTAEYGRARIKRLSRAVSTIAPEKKDELCTRFHFLLLSRTALRDPATGMPTFKPMPSHFGLDPKEDFELDSAATFIRTAHYSPFHGTRKRPECERHVIERGGVITFKSSRGLRVSEVQARIDGGVGDYRHEGLGEVVVNPAWLLGERFEAVRVRRPGAVQLAPEPRADGLFAWAKDIDQRQRAARDAFTGAEKHSAELMAFKLPKSQWGQIAAMAREARYREDGDEWLRKELERFLTKGVRSLSGRWGTMHGQTSARNKLLALLFPKESQEPAPVARERLSVRLELLANVALRQTAEARKGGTP